MNWKWCLAILVCVFVAFVPLEHKKSYDLHVASKSFTESVILGEIATLLATHNGDKPLHHKQLGGTRVVFDALVKGEIDVYPDYSGTLLKEIFSESKLDKFEELASLLEKKGISMTQSLGFENSYAMGMLREQARKLNIRKVSDLRNHPELKFRFSNEFMERSDGWSALKEEYDLPQQNVSGVEHDIAYRQLSNGSIDLIDIYTTDAKIQVYDIFLLQDDRNFFPDYFCIFLYRKELERSHPRFIKALKKLENGISTDEMQKMNTIGELTNTSETRTAANFLKKNFSIDVEVEEETRFDRIYKTSIDHFELVRKSLIAAILVAISLGIFAAKNKRVGRVVLAVVGIVQTIPALALLVLLMDPVHWLGFSTIGSGSATAVVALFLYSLLPIVRNTVLGLAEVSTSYKESADALGMSSWSRLRLIELPLAYPSILAGIKTAAVINVGFATLGGLIGAGGYGQPIMTGIRLNRTSLILEGAISAAVMALVVQGIFELVERITVSRGLRIEAAE